MRRCGFIFTLLIGCGLLLASCGRNTESPSGFDILATGETVPVAAAQFVSLKERMHRGLSLQSAEELHVATLEAKDLQGNPFVYLNFAAPTPIDDPYTFGLSLDGSEWAGDRDDSPWTMTVTGAETNRDVHYMNTIGLELLMDLAKAVEALGGEANIKGLVAATPTLFWIEDKSGVLWEPVSREVVPANIVKDYRSDYSQLVEDMDDPKYLDYLEQAWECELDSDECYMSVSSMSMAGFEMEDAELESLSQGSYSFDLESLTQKNGSLDVAKAAKEVQAQIAPELHAQGWFGGDLIAGRQAHMPLQEPWAYGRSSTYFNGVHRCAYQYGQPSNTALLGCGPAAFISLIWRDWAGYDAGNGVTSSEAGIKFYGQAFPSYRSRTDIGFDTQTWDELASSYSAWDDSGVLRYDGPMQVLTARRSDGQVDIQHWLHSCWFVNNPMTTGDDWRTGVNQWLAYQHDIYNTPRMRVVGNTSNGPGNPSNKGPKHAMLMKRLRTDVTPIVAKPIIALFPSDNKAAGSYHISPVHRYNKSGRGIFATLHVSSIDRPYGQYNIGAYWVAETGVFYTERY